VGGERFITTLTRATIWAGVLGFIVMLILPGHGGLAWDYVDAFSIAFCFTFIGHYVEAFLRALPQIEVGAGRLVRLAGWFAGGLWCYIVARWLWLHYGRDLAELPRLAWGGVWFVAFELVVHALMKSRGEASFYD
jgi:hypothetical protein